MQPTNPTQFDDSKAGRVPAPEALREGVWSIPLPMDQPGNPYSLCYVVADDNGSLHLIDSGYATDANWELLLTSLEGFGLSIDDVATLFATHLHPDHLGMADRLRAASGARIELLDREREALVNLSTLGLRDADERFASWGVPENRRPELHAALSASALQRSTPQIDRTYFAGENLDIPGRRLTVLATPGHTTGSASIVDAESGLIYTGDTVLPTIFPGLGLGDRGEANPIADYLASLAALEAYGDHEVAPGHGYRFRGLRERVAELAEHHLQRSRAAAEVIRAHPDDSVWQVASRLRWSAGWENLSSFYLVSALSQTELHLRFVGSSEFPG